MLALSSRFISGNSLFSKHFKLLVLYFNSHDRMTYDWGSFKNIHLYISAISIFLWIWLIVNASNYRRVYSCPYNIVTNCVVSEWIITASLHQVADLTLSISRLTYGQIADLNLTLSITKSRWGAFMDHSHSDHALLFIRKKPIVSNANKATAGF